MVHESRLTFFQNADFEVTEEVNNHLECQTGEKCTVDRFVSNRRKDLWELLNKCGVLSK